MEKIKILVIPSDTKGGVGFYRSSQPHKYLQEKYPDEFEVMFNIQPVWDSFEYFSHFDIIHIHKGLFGNMAKFYEMMGQLKNSKTVMVMDIDDSWDLSPTHPLYLTQKQYHLDDLVKNNLKLFDYVTTTTPLFASEISQFNQNVKVSPNAINPNDERFQINRKPYDKIRVGFIMGSAHEADVKQMGDFVAQLKPETLEKIQINLCGFDLRGTVRSIDQRTGKSSERPIQPMETTWYRYENMVTNNRKILSDKYRKFLNMFVPNLDYPKVDEEHYRRNWTKDMDHYYKHYENVDILYAPLEVKHFNYVKSQLKAIECCFSHTALIATNYGPYTIDLKHALDENGNFVEGGNALLVNTENNATDWAKYTELLVNNPDILKKLQDNIHDTLKDKYNLDTVTDERAEFYRSIVKKA